MRLTQPSHNYIFRSYSSDKGCFTKNNLEGTDLQTDAMEVMQPNIFYGYELNTELRLN